MKEYAVRPENLFDEFLSLAAQDARTFFADIPMNKISCPACGESDTRGAFHKHGFQYEMCASCDTLFANPRPDSKSLKRYYEEAPSIRFLATHFYRETEGARRKSLMKPRARLVLDKIKAFRVGGEKDACGWIADVGAGHGVFCEELRAIVPGETEIVAIEPSPEMASTCQSHGTKVVPMHLEEMTRADLPVASIGPGMLTSFELLEHVQDPVEFLSAARRLLESGGLLIATTLNGLGMDIQLLWEKSKSVHPPHHLNFFNPHSIKTLFRRGGFDVLEVSTPGLLDVSIIENSLGKMFIDRFWSNFLGQLGEEGKEQFQGFLRNRGMSSHMMIVARCQ